MTIEIKVPQMGESVNEATVADWHFQEGDAFQSGNILVELETDKVTLEVPAPSNGILKEIKCPSGKNVKIGEILALIEEKTQSSSSESKDQGARAAAETPRQEGDAAKQKNETLSPGAARLATEHHIDPKQIDGSGKRGQVTKADIVQFIDQSEKQKLEQTASVSHTTNAQKTAPASHAADAQKKEELAPLSRLRQRIAERLLEAQRTAAILTTFNEIDMHNTIEMRKRYKESFQKKYGVTLGFMSIFIKAAVHALKAVPTVNAEVRENNIVYKNYYDISVAVGGPKGLVVPVVRNADQLSFSEIEIEIARLAAKVKAGTIDLQDLEGGTFTISNGGVYGSMLSTPILNPPQSGILGMHNIVKRPVVINDEICIRPVMFTALSYDHRIIDGKEAVSFLVKIKETIENPERLLLNI